MKSKIHVEGSLINTIESRFNYNSNRIEYNDPEIKAKNAEIKKLMEENNDLQEKLKSVSEGVNKILAKAKLPNSTKETKKFSLVDELEWLEKNIINFEKESKLLRSKLNVNINDKIIESVAKLVRNKKMLEDTQRNIKLKKSQIQYKEKLLFHYEQVNSPSKINSALKLLIKEIQKENNRKKELEERIVNTQQHSYKRQEKIKRLSVQTNPFAKVLLRIPSGHTSCKSRLLSLKDEYTKLKKVYKEEVKNNIRQKTKLYNQIMQIKLMLRTGRSSSCLRKKTYKQSRDTISFLLSLNRTLHC